MQVIQTPAETAQNTHIKIAKVFLDKPKTKKQTMDAKQLHLSGKIHVGMSF